ncbi:hypothetical protein QJS04_geneDACA007095 [Acorus gramineus]|uniref:Uncharacterized protein n=1 Tax=Acorus gramineus TaxID=55184 RepID=A0AAV9BSU2_ACOGR|nr:hypothetical protein QJS04_geneDACA007095 [Acorus gramineus]
MGSVVTPQAVLESLMNDGTIDAIRLKIINQLKANEELKNNTIKMLEQSKVLNTPGAENKTKRELFDALRGELETSVLEKASRAVWDLILDNDGLGKEISETVEKVYCQLSGQEPPLFPPNGEAQPEEEKKEAEEKREQGTEQEIDKGKKQQKGKEENSGSLKKKRTHSEMNLKGTTDMHANGLGTPSTAPGEDGVSSSAALLHDSSQNPLPS